MSRQYVTTAIDYPNAAPHMGHALEKILADVTARWFRLRGDAVRFQIGTDEHGIKIQQTAKKEGITPRQLVDRNVPLFEELYGRLGISADLFIRTSDGPVMWANTEAFSHRDTVVALWKRLAAAGALEKRAYTGLYCAGCERFVTEKDLVDGLCPDHKVAPQKVEEENWFFLLTREGAWLKDLLTRSDGYRIIPAYRANETLSLVESGLEDVSFSRPVSSLSWGIPVPDEEGQTMYVWCDALTNYLSGIGYLTDREQKDWWDGATVTHVIGKDIARFHALIWPAMLKQAGIKTPDRLLIHGFLTSEGQKMSKSLGNVVVPQEVLEKYGVDALRFYLSHEIPVGNDGDFSWKRFAELYDSALRNTIGNLLNRVLVMLRKEGGALALPDSPAGFAFDGKTIEQVWADYAERMDAFEPHRAVQMAVQVASALNVFMNEKAPWKLAGEERIATLSAFAEHLRHLTLMLLPFIPEAACRMAAQLGLPDVARMGEKAFVITPAMRTWGGTGEWNQAGEPAILFVPVETEKKD